MKSKKLTKAILVTMVLVIGIGIGVFTTLAYQKPITITMPDYCFGYEVDHSIIDLYQKQNLIQSAEINSDKSVTMTMSRSQQRSMLKTISESADRMLQQIPFESVDSNILSIEHNEDFTDYKIVMMNDTYKPEDTQVLSTLTYIQAVYGSVCGNNNEDLTIHFLCESGDKSFGVFTLSHVGTENESEFEKQFMDTYKNEMLRVYKQETGEPNLSTTEDPREIEGHDLPEKVIEDQIQKNGMN